MVQRSECAKRIVQLFVTSDDYQTNETGSDLVMPLIAGKDRSQLPLYEVSKVWLEAYSLVGLGTCGTSTKDYVPRG